MNNRRSEGFSCNYWLRSLYKNLTRYFFQVTFIMSPVSHFIVNELRISRPGSRQSPSPPRTRKAPQATARCPTSNARHRGGGGTPILRTSPSQGRRPQIELASNRPSAESETERPCYAFTMPARTYSEGISHAKRSAPQRPTRFERYRKTRPKPTARCGGNHSVKPASAINPAATATAGIVAVRPSSHRPASAAAAGSRIPAGATALPTAIRPIPKRTALAIARTDPECLRSGELRRPAQPTAAPRNFSRQDGMGRPPQIPRLVCTHCATRPRHDRPHRQLLRARIHDALGKRCRPRLAQPAS